MGYSDTIIFRPGFLAGAERADARIAETIFGYADFAIYCLTLLTSLYAHRKITSLASKFTSNAEINVALLGKSIVNAGHLGSAALPPSAEPYKAGDSTPYTIIGNKGATALGKAEV